MQTRRLFLLTVGLVACGMASCQPASDRKPTFPVTGKVLLPDGKPAAHASVVLHPASAGPNDPRPHGKVNPDGTFRLTTYAPDDGAPAGDYRVTVELWLAGRPDEGPVSKLPAKYAKPESSGLTATVTAGPTELQPIALKK